MKKISWDSMAEALSDEERQLNRKIQEARSDAITFLGLAKKPSGRVAQQLRDEGFAESIISEVIRELTEEGYIDDLLIARRMVRQRLGRQAESRFALRQRLLQAGLSRDSVDQAVAETLSNHELARHLLDARFASEVEELRGQKLPHPEKRRLFMKIARFLGSRGFDSELISQLLHLGDE